MFLLASNPPVASTTPPKARTFTAVPSLRIRTPSTLPWLSRIRRLPGASNHSWILSRFSTAALQARYRELSNSFPLMKKQKQWSDPSYSGNSAQFIR